MIDPLILLPKIQTQQRTSQLRQRNRHPHAVHAQQCRQDQQAGDDQPKGSHKRNNGGHFTIFQRRKQSRREDIQPGEEKTKCKDGKAMTCQLIHRSS